MDNVAVKKCSNYEYENVYAAIKQGIDLLGGIEKFVKQKNKVLIKPNLLAKSKAEQCLVTHPVVVKAIVDMVTQAGGEVVVADSPGGVYNLKVMENVYNLTDYKNIIGEQYLNYNCDYTDVILPNGKYLKKTKIINPAIDADVIINVPKLKTHGFARMSCGVKNLFGLVPGIIKAEYHMKFADEYSFCGALVDIASYAKPAITIVDAVYSLEGQGPGASGTPRFTGYIFAGQNVHALDSFCEKFINITEVFTLKQAKKQKLYDEVNLLGDEVEIIKDYKQAQAAGTILRAPKIIKQLFGGFLAKKPKQDTEKCILCGECVKDCPAKAIIIKDKTLCFDYKKCIRCLCCQELCPKDAIFLSQKKNNTKKK